MSFAGSDSFICDARVRVYFWSAELGRQLTSLRVLNIGENRLAPLTPEVAAGLKGALASVRVLVLSDTPVSWGEVRLLQVLAPQLEELHLGRCGVFPVTDAPASWSVADGGRVVVADGGTSFLPDGLFTSLKVSRPIPSPYSRVRVLLI